LCAACARQSSPSGGEKDETPPVVLEAQPGQEAVNFSTNKIVLTFNEYVKLNNLQKELIISPYLEEQPKVLLKGKSLVVKLQQALKENTTYSFNFGKAIGDNTENNLAENLTYVFSTGNFIDSLTISGKVVDTTNGKAVKEALVFLYESSEDSLIFKQQPDYLTKSDENGLFQFKHLPPKTFQLAALNNSNNNLLYDGNNEQLAFSSDLVQPEDSLSFTHRLLLYQPVLSKQWQVEATKDTGIFKLFINNIDSPVLKVIDDSTTLNHYNYNYEQDSIKAFYSTLKKAAEFTFFDTDSLLDTLRIKQNEVDTLANTFKLRAWGSNQNQYNLLIDTTLENTTFQLTSKYPLELIDTNRFEILQDSIAFREVTFSINAENPLLLDVQAAWQAESTYQLAIQDSALTNIFKQTSQTDTLQLNPVIATQIELTLNNADSLKTYLAQLFEGKNKFIKAQNLDSLKTTFDDVFPGKYLIKIIEDANQNGQWDNGIYGKAQPEQIFTTGEEPFQVKEGLVHSIDLTVQ